MKEASRIVVVDDEEPVRETFREHLESQGYDVTALDGGAALRRLVEAGERFDLAVLDVLMPGEDGMSLARFLRERSSAGVVMVTALDGVVARVVGLETGADAYIAKPVDLRELLARVRSVLRRRASADRADSHGPDQRMRFGRCILDLRANTLFDESGEPILPSAMEFDLLKAFAENPNRVLSREQLLELARDRDLEPFDRSIDIRVARLRRKVEVDPARPTAIKTMRGAGYMFVA